jgi:colicin import membrane protein
MSSVAAPGLPPGLGPQAPLPPARARLPRQSTWPGFFAALFMHAALVGYLWFAVQWHTSAVAPAVAVLWDLPAPVETLEAPPPTPQAPTDAPPPPPTQEKVESPPKPDIVEKAERQKKKEETPAPPKEAPPVKKESKPKPAPQASAKELQRQAERQRVEELARLASQAGEPGRTPVPSTPGRLTNEYTARVRAAVLANVHYAPTEQDSGSLYAEYVITLIPSTGEVVGEPQLTHASGLPGWDDAVLRAIQHTDPFPLQEDGKAPSSLKLRFYPTDTR